MSENIKKIAVLTSGGDAPGMNAAVRAVVRTASYYDLQVYGISRGYDGLINGDIELMNKRNVANIIHRGGTFLKTARSEAFRTVEGRKKAFETLNAYDIDGLVVIGGNGTYTGAHIFGQEHDIKIVGIPGTIDNDIFGTDFTIGFDTAINTAVEAVDKIRDTADSHNRLFFIEVMGRHSGYIALHTAIGSGASAVFIPEVDLDLEDFVENLKKASRRNKLFNLVIIAEGNKNGGAQELANKVKEMYPQIDAKATIIGHLQRGGSPTANDRVLASHLGYKAVESLLNGASDKALGIVSNELLLSPFKDAISLRKDPDSDMIKMSEILSL
ncbi:MAG: 6-phosphofructokinase [Saprospiraceae bacterium]|nr:6-phosphofructokinase [Bacteroidia bacterium]NNE16092.1 6-phosphofructokinase [Saprospiraceae bacterium]NNL90652.1 6-phosphofructokinase [Saprospiraceae bacterium]